MQRDNAPQIIAAKPILAVLVHVPDTSAALAWYESALPGAIRKRLLEPEPLEYLELGGVMLEIVPADEKVTNAAAGSVVYWNTPDFEASLLHLLSVGPPCTVALVTSSTVKECAKSAIPGAIALVFAGQCSRPAMWPNPSVKGTSRKRAAPYVER